MINITDCVNEIVGVLNGVFSGEIVLEGINADLGDGRLLSDIWEAKAFPENAEQLLQDYEKITCNVLYSNDLPGKPKTTANIAQEEMNHVVVVIQANKLLGRNNGYDCLHTVKQILTGYRPENSTTRMWMSGFADYDIIDGQLWPAVQFSFGSMAQQLWPDEEPAMGGDLVRVEPWLGEWPGTGDSPD